MWVLEGEYGEEGRVFVGLGFLLSLVLGVGRVYFFFCYGVGGLIFYVGRERVFVGVCVLVWF